MRKRVVELVDQNHRDLGIEVEECLVQSRAPRQLQDAFNNVAKAEQTRGQVQQQAQGYANQVLSKASADARGRLNAAESDSVRLVKDVQSQAKRFTEILPEFRKN